MKNALKNAISLLGGVEGLSLDLTAVKRRRDMAKVQERQWSALRRAHALSVEQRSVLRRGGFKLD